ncbi:aminoglycoside phosphotransferase (APT) family kinase protein [Spinactinospora alkalitolerans]|uniref:Aminoglycoside phosphotransferase (APT) family kinase protein n=1 Tax=Spinactinospora alkalitolerans TaxID=687207 RepID=A0A852U038_9ACTN|nr:phosphotransferase [Spinactinospora alkalitolerans]NYE49548.1 aminoglycoside phosphotransferase (APT) family kinase protein [Spinactinospora alkalitolerans]
MLQAADVELVDRDPGVPGLGAVLDPEPLMERLTGPLPPGAEGPARVRTDYLRYKPGTGVTGTLVLEYPGAGVRFARVTALAPEPGGGKLDKEIDYARRRGGRAPDHRVDVSQLSVPEWDGPIVDRGLSLVVVPPLDDRGVPAVRHFAAAPEAFTSPGARRVRTLRYKPGRRWVGRVDDAEGRPTHAVRCRAGSVNVAAHIALAGAGLPVPDLTRISRHGVLATRWIPGESMEALLEAGGREAARAPLAGAGALLARVHGVATPRELPAVETGSEFGESGALGGLGGAVRAVTALLPGLEERTEALARACAPVLTDPAAPRTLVHGDFSADQVLIGASGLALIDLDRVRAANPAVDLASFAAAEIAAGRTAPGTAPAAALGPLLEGYLATASAAAADRLRHDLPAHTAAALLRRATDPFRHRAPEWDSRVRALIAAAEASLPRRS